MERAACLTVIEGWLQREDDELLYEPEEGPSGFDMRQPSVVKKQSGKYPTWTKSDWFRDEAEARRAIAEEQT